MRTRGRQLPRATHVHVAPPASFLGGSLSGAQLLYPRKVSRSLAKKHPRRWFLVARQLLLPSAAASGANKLLCAGRSWSHEPRALHSPTNTLLEMKKCKSSKVCRTVASGQVLSHPESWIPQVEAPLLLLRSAVRHKRPGEERGEPAAALHRSGVCVQCCCVCRSVCVFVCVRVSHPPSLALSPPERRIPAPDTPLSTNQRAAAALRSDTKQSV